MSKVCVQCHRGRVTAVPFGILVLGTVLLIGALSFLPVLALGPIAEYLKTAAGV
ncbi:MAG: potassium-transporting ATPase subunit KdpA [Isosphaeraceae bacterium]